MHPVHRTAVPAPTAARALAAALLAFVACASAREPAMPTQPSSAMPTPGATCCAVVELRQYTLHPFKRDVLIDLFEREFVESQEATGIRLIGTFRDLANPDRFVWLRGFSGMPGRRDALQAFYDGPVWQAHRDTANATMIDSNNVLLLQPLQAGTGFPFDDRALAPRDAVAIPPGLVEARLLYLPALPTPAQRALAASIASLQAQAGATPLAAFATEPAQNSFPRLPVREGESVLAWFAQFADRAGYERYLAALARSPRWQAAMGTLGEDAPRAPDILLLSPTARSRLPR
jgi:hypothetical protein